MSELKEDHPYYIECVHFDSEPPKRAATVLGAEPGVRVQCEDNFQKKSQQFFVTAAPGGFEFTSVDPKTNVFVGFLVPGALVVSTPYQKQAFRLRNPEPAPSNVYQIFVEVGGKEYAFEAGKSITRPGYPREITLQPSDLTNAYQLWRFVPVNIA